MPEFDAAVFAPTAKTGVLLKPVNTSQYGWFVIEPLAADRAGEDDARGEGRAGDPQAAPATKEQSVARAPGSTKIEKTYCSGGKIAYQAGYTPSPDPCALDHGPNPTTT